MLFTLFPVLYAIDFSGSARLLEYHCRLFSGLVKENPKSHRKKPNESEEKSSEKKFCPIF